MVVLIFRCPIKSFLISIGTPALTRNVAAKWRNDLNEWPWYPALLQALSISVLITFVLAAWKNDWFFSIGKSIKKEHLLVFDIWVFQPNAGSFLGTCVSTLPWDRLLSDKEKLYPPISNQNKSRSSIYFCTSLERDLWFAIHPILQGSCFYRIPSACFPTASMGIPSSLAIQIPCFATSRCPSVLSIPLSSDRMCRRGLWRPWAVKVMAWFMPSP